ncbi:hypothetical protein HMPREF9057_00680, partial [Actinomyces sp. oral taxon 171 str. F0337]
GCTCWLGSAGSGLGGLGRVAGGAFLGRQFVGSRRSLGSATRLGGLSTWLGSAGTRFGGGRLGSGARSPVLSTGGSRLGSLSSWLGSTLGGLGGLRGSLGRLVDRSVRRRFLHLGGEVLTNPASDGGLNGGGGRLDELSLVLEPGQDHLRGDLLASGVELFSELMNAWFSHITPVRFPTPDRGGCF